MNVGMRRARSCRAIPVLACWLWLSGLLSATAAQPTIDVTTLSSAIDDTFLSLPAAERTSLLWANPATDSKTLSDAPRLAQNKPRLYSVERVGINPQRETDTQPRWQWSLATGYRQDDLKWNIAGPLPESPLFEALLPGLDPSLAGTYVNILSELSWTDITVLQFEFGLQRQFENNLRFEGLLGYGIIVDGKVQDSDYAGNNRTLEFSRSNNGADNGDVWDLSLALGYDASFLSDMITLTPLVGFSYHVQNLSMVDGVQTVSNYGWPTPLGSFGGLDSSYDTDWYGPWIGGDIGFIIRKKDLTGPAHRFWLGGEWHFFNEYQAEANWNLRPDFAHPLSFEHEADASGWVLDGGYTWFMSPRWALDLKGRYQKWETESGIDRVFFFDGTSVTTPLNEVKWDSYAATIGVSCRW